MMYLRIAGVNFPVAPEEISTETVNKNTAFTLVNEKEINIPRKPGLSEYSMDIRLPDEEYSWAYWQQDGGSAIGSGFNTPDVYVDFLNKLKTDKSIFTLMIVEDDGGSFACTVTLETMTVTESKEWTVASCTFKQYTDVVTRVKKKTTTSGKVSKKPKKSSYTVADGDTLKKISKKMYGTQDYASKIYSWNKSAIEKAAKNHGRKSSSNGKYIYKGTKLTLKTIK